MHYYIIEQTIQSSICTDKCMHIKTKKQHTDRMYIMIFTDKTEMIFPGTLIRPLSLHYKIIVNKENLYNFNSVFGLT